MAGSDKLAGNKVCCCGLVKDELAVSVTGGEVGEIVGNAARRWIRTGAGSLVGLMKLLSKPHPSPVIIKIKTSRG